MSIPAAFDHLVLAVPDLEEGVRRFTELTGVVPTAGGRHPGKGTANYLVGLAPVGWETGDGSDAKALTYLEIIGPDLEQTLPEGTPYSFDVDKLTEMTLRTWAIHPEGFDERLAAAEAAGVDYGFASEMSRTTPDGELLEWRLTQRFPLPAGGTQPFLIDWMDSTHPALTDIGIIRFDSFEVVTPDVPGTRAALEVLGAADTEVVEGSEYRIRATLSGPAGSVSFGD